VASDTTESQLLVLNHLTAPGCPVVWAVRMSMSIPLVSEGIISQVKQVAEGAASVIEKLDRIRQELKTEIQEAWQEILAALKFSYA